MRFGAFEALTGASKRGQLPDRVGQPAMDMVNGMLAGSVEAVLCQTPNQVIAIKMIHDASPRGPRRYKGLLHAVGTMWREGGFLGFYRGCLPPLWGSAVCVCAYLASARVLARCSRYLRLSSVRSVGAVCSL